jgi:uncharacterized protein YkwD
LALVCACAFALTGGPGAATASAPNARATRGCAGADLHPSAANAGAVDAATLCLIDAIRASHRLRPLRTNRSLGGVASSQASTMVDSDYFADDRPSGQTPMALIGVSAYSAHAEAIAVGQNIAWGTGSHATPRHIVAEWMASPPHRAVILTRQYRDVGIGMTPALPSVLGAGRRGATYAVEFADRRY